MATPKASYPWYAWAIFILIGGITLGSCISAPPVSLVGIALFLFARKLLLRFEEVADDIQDIRQELVARDRPSFSPPGRD